MTPSEEKAVRWSDDRLRRNAVGDALRSLNATIRTPM
jgi:hypothetical protein